MTTSASTRTTDFTAVLNLPTSPDEVAALFTSPAGVSRWWGPTEGDGRVGGTLVAAFGDYGVNAVRVRAAGPSRIVWEPIVAEGTTPTGHTQEWLGTSIEVDLAADGPGTVLRFRHAGLTPQLDCWEDCFAGWTYYMASIESVVRTGTGTPFGA